VLVEFDRIGCERVGVFGISPAEPLFKDGIVHERVAVVVEIVGFWTPEYLSEKLDKIRAADLDNLLLAVSEQLDCASGDFDAAADRVLWFKTGIHVYDVVDLAEEYAVQTVQ
jgi:predicted nuclease of restriction endonuclease-like RecB superfamily